MDLPNLEFLFSLNVVEVVFLAWLITYIGILSGLFYHYRRLDPQPEDPNRTDDVTLIIPFRNEEKNMIRLAQQLTDRLPQAWKVIWVDDHSDDASVRLIREWLDIWERLPWNVLSADGEGKKCALRTGIEAASSEIVVTTDADVSLSEYGFCGLIDPFLDKQIQLVAGPVMSQEGKGFFAKFQQIEWASILLVTGAFFRLGRPLMCSGANLAFRRQAFFEVGGYEGNEHILSGDDEFLLKKMADRFGPEALAYNFSMESLIYIPAERSVSAFLQQRIRWASKWQSHGSRLHALSAVLASCFASFPYLSLFLLVFGSVSGWLVGLIFIGRFLGDGVVLTKVLGGLGRRATWSLVALVDLVHPAYVLAVTYGVFRGGYTWKGRKNNIFH
nr:glycosyltransferase [Cytophagales bacterium]